MPTSGRLVWFVTLVAAMALGTWAFGWGAVVIVSGAWAWIRRADGAITLLSAVAGVAAWAVLLGLQAMQGPVGRVADVVGAAMQVGAGPLVLLTLAFPALLAGATAGVVRGLAAER